MLTFLFRCCCWCCYWFACFPFSLAQTRLIALWSSLETSSADMLAMLDKYASAEGVGRLGMALPLWERCAATWSNRKRALREVEARRRRQREKQQDALVGTGADVVAAPAPSPQQPQQSLPALSPVDAHGCGGPDGHGSLLSTTLAAAEACLELFLRSGGAEVPVPGAELGLGPESELEGDEVRVCGVPLLLLLLVGAELDCCALAARVQEEVQRIHVHIQEAAQRRRALLQQHRERAELSRRQEVLDAQMQSLAPASGPDNGPDSSAPVPPSLLHHYDPSSPALPFAHPPPPPPRSLHPRPLLPGHFMALVRGHSVLQLPSGQNLLVSTDEEAAMQLHAQPSSEQSRNALAEKQNQHQGGEQPGRPYSARNSGADAAAATAVVAPLHSQKKHPVGESARPATARTRPATATASRSASGSKSARATAAAAAASSGFSAALASQFQQRINNKQWGMFI